MTLVVQLVGLLGAGLGALIAGEGLPGPDTIVIGLVAGLIGVSGILALYHGLAVGRMGVVAPITGVIAAVLPVAVGFVIEGSPGPGVIVGIVIALVAVVLVSQAPAEAGRPTGIVFGFVAGTAIGTLNILLGTLPEGAVFVPLVLLKIAAGTALVLVIASGRRPWRVAGPVLPVAIGVGVADICGNLFFVLASQTGRLDVASVLSSLYPVTTIVLAVVLLKERVGRVHAVGIVAAGLAIALIAGGSAG